MSTPSGFWFRRLARFMPCVFSNVGSGALALRSKWELASARDVFFSAHYWRMFDHVEKPPALVLDLGAHCGHFLVLCHLMAVEKFGGDSARYIAVEPLAEMLPRLRATLEDTGISSRVQVIHALAGRRSGDARLFSGASSRMDASVFRTDAAMESRGDPVRYIDIEPLIPPGAEIDILKLDIEGSEHQFVREHPDLLARTRLLALELHPVEGESMDGLCGKLEDLGLKSCSSPIMKPDGCRMLLFQR